MRAREFLNQLQHDEIVAAIRKAERATTGEIRVFISRMEPVDALAAARAQFARMGMNRSRERNGVLIFVAPRVRRFAVVGDKAIHTHCGEEFWQRIVAEMSRHFETDEFTQAILHAVHAIGEILARHFPRPHGNHAGVPEGGLSEG